MDITKLSNLLTLKDDGSEVSVMLGWVTIATLVEEEGYWYPSVIFTCDTVPLKEIGSQYSTKEEAFKCVVGWFAP